MFALNSCSLFIPSKPSALRCRAAGDILAGPTFPRWFQFSSSTEISGAGGFRIGHDSEAAAKDGSARFGGVGIDGLKVNAKEKRWSRRGKSYLDDASDALPLPMTYPDSSPVPPEEIDRRLRCDPQLQIKSCKEMLTGYVILYPENLHGKLGFTMWCLVRVATYVSILEFTRIIFIIAGYVQKITARKDIEVMEDLDNGRPP